MKLVEKIYSKRQNEEVISKYEIFKSSADYCIKGFQSSAFIPADLSCLRWGWDTKRTSQWGVPEEELGGRRTVTYYLEKD